MRGHSPQPPVLGYGTVLRGDDIIERQRTDIMSIPMQDSRLDDGSACLNCHTTTAAAHILYQKAATGAAPALSVRTGSCAAHLNPRNLKA